MAAPLRSCQIAQTSNSRSTFAQRFSQLARPLAGNITCQCRRKACRWISCGLARVAGWAFVTPVGSPRPRPAGPLLPTRSPALKLNFPSASSGVSSSGRRLVPWMILSRKSWQDWLSYCRRWLSFPLLPSVPSASEHRARPATFLFAEWAAAPAHCFELRCFEQGSATAGSWALWPQIGLRVLRATRWYYFYSTISTGTNYRTFYNLIITNYGLIYCALLTGRQSRNCNVTIRLILCF